MAEDSRSNLVLVGTPGVGKTHIAMALGREARRRGYNVKFFTTAGLVIPADDLIELLRRNEHTSGNRAKRRQHMTGKVLIIDELGFQALNRQDAHRLFRLINHRYEVGSTIITSNKSIWE